MLLDDGEGGCRYLVLINNENLTYDDVFQDMISSNMIDIESAGYVVLDIL